MRVGGAKAPANSHHKTQTPPPKKTIKKLHEAARLAGRSQGVREVCKQQEVSPPTDRCWRQEYGRAKEERMKRLKALEKENTHFKKLVADLSLDKAMVKEPVEGAERSETACRRQPEG